MPKITKRDLITHCRRRDSEVCNDCEYKEPCAVFFKQTGDLPCWADDKQMTEEVIKREDGEQNES